MTREEKVEICQRRDKSYTGKFYLAVKSTKIVCNPGCSSKVPLEKNMMFYDTLEELNIETVGEDLPPIDDDELLPALDEL